MGQIIIESGKSAKSLNRPGMTKLLAMLEVGKAKTVIVGELDRLTRSVKLDAGSAAGRLVLNIMAAVSQWEREVIGERTRDALSRKLSRANEE